MSKTIAELEAENAQLRRSNSLLEEVVRRLLSEKPESTEKMAPATQPQIVPVPYPYHVPSGPPFPAFPGIKIEPVVPHWTGPSWGIVPPPDWTVITCETACGVLS